MTQPPTNPPTGQNQPPQVPPVQGAIPPVGYPAPGAFTPSGYPGQGGYPQPPAPGKSSGRLIGIVVAAVLALAMLGGGIMLMTHPRTSAPTPTVPVPDPTQSSMPTTDPTMDPTTDPTTEPTSAPTTEPTTGGVVSLGNGVKLTVADGWTVLEKSSTVVEVSDDKAIMLSQVAKVKTSTNASQMCDSYHRQILADATGAKFGDPKEVDAGFSTLSVAQCAAAYVETSGSRSIQMYVVSYVAVRTADGIATVSTALYPKDTPQTSFADIGKMLESVLASQAAG